MFASYVNPSFTEIMDNKEAIKTDKTNRKDIYKFINYIKSKTDHLDCLVFNAGMSIHKYFTETLNKDWDVMIKSTVNFRYIMVRELYSNIPAGFRILFTSLQMGLNPYAIVLAYSVIKSAVHALCKGYC